IRDFHVTGVQTCALPIFDSMVLLTVLLQLPLRLKLAVFHLNHGLRPEAEEEAALVARYAAAHDLPCFITRPDCDLQTAAGHGSQIGRASCRERRQCCGCG